MNKDLKILCLQGSFSENQKSHITHSPNFKLGPVTNYHYRLRYGIPFKNHFFWMWDTLDAHYKQSDPVLLDMYKEIAELAKSHDVLYHFVGDMMHPEFIKHLSKRNGGPIFTIYNVDGEPASSEVLSHPVVYAYDSAMTCSKHFDELRTCPQMLLAKGAYVSDWVACGTKYPQEHWAWQLPIDEESEAKKDIDVIFLGANMKYQMSGATYPPNKYKAVEFLREKGLNVHCEEWTGLDQAAELYKRSKVGICLHGPSPYGVGNSQRLYDLAVCGVGIVTDGATLGIDEIFEKDEVESYIWSNFEEMYAHVKILLDNPIKRIRQAQKAREKVRLKYRNDTDDSWMIRAITQSINMWEQKGIWKTK